MVCLMAYYSIEEAGVPDKRSQYNAEVEARLVVKAFSRGVATSEVSRRRGLNAGLPYG